jgi:hypothetical protein
MTTFLYSIYISFLSIFCTKYFYLYFSFLFIPRAIVTELWAPRPRAAYFYDRGAFEIIILSPLLLLHYYII